MLSHDTCTYLQRGSGPVGISGIMRPVPSPPQGGDAFRQPAAFSVWSDHNTRESPLRMRSLHWGRAPR